MSRRVKIRHPGYSRPNILLEFPARDGQTRDRAHYVTIVTACSIIADHPSGMRLEQTATGEQVRPDSEGLMPAGDFNLIVPAAEDSVPYPVVPNFGAWLYPHRDLPQPWQEAAESDGSVSAALRLDSIAIERCRISNKRLALNKAHIIPAREQKWFDDNEMADYCGLSGRGPAMAIESPANLLNLQMHAHHLWDSLQFCIVPRKVGDEMGWVTQIMVDDDEVEQDWHYKRLQPLEGRAKEYLYARFAWHIFPRMIQFLGCNKPRVLAVALSDGTKEIREFTADECYRFSLGQGKYRSASSPSKRQRSQVDHRAPDEDGRGYDSSSDVESQDSGVAGILCDKDAGWPSPDRGRKRTRT